MGILQLYPPKEFYISIEPREFRPGQFCWVVTPHIDPVPRILDVERSSPEEHDEVSFVLRNANKSGDFRTRDRTLPLKNLNLRSHEELLTQRAKKRLGIILSTGVDIFPEIERLLKPRGKAHCQEDSLFVIPTYSIESGTSLSGFPPEMVARIRCLIYRQFFYFPDCPLFNEGVARFDRIQVISGRNPSAIEPLDIALSQDVFALFLAMFVYCITGIEDNNLIDIREMVKDALPE
jgi:hypothetical protein